MSALTDTLAVRTRLDDAQVDHIARLVGEWQLLADLAFADLLLWVPVAVPAAEAGAVPGFLCVAQCRPTTGPTAYQHDQVGVVLQGNRVAPLRIALAESRIFREVDPDWEGDLPIRREAIPVRLGDEVIAVIGRDANLASVRTPSQLELVYLQSAADLAGMVADGTFPAADSRPEEGAGPRVGDGLARLEPDGTIIYASPNALSAFSRLGVTGPVLSEPIDALTSSVADDPFDATDLAAAVADAIDGGHPASIEVEGRGATILFRAWPLRPRGETLGALLLMQDVTELRRRDLQIMSKDATIREIHHRVKNNLQTVAALLRLQARRVAVPEARAALEESMRRVQSIALVHETLSVSIEEAVEFDDIVDRLLSMLSDVMGSAQRVDAVREGSFGVVPAAAATPLVLVLTELVQNAIEHAFPEDGEGMVTVLARRRRGRLTVTIRDDGVGLPEGFTGGKSDRLGLQIVNTLVSAELSGEVSYRPNPRGRGTDAVLDLPLTPRRR
ncbi:Two-component sensor histidine kinase, contains HisKA and HATPase domains [Jatrophihabitans endophyticus]|uniref:histidine kinase n=1 Tax=Jatrophihabitans endophyticus TaxID=1206085 RepID=A0A1M5E8P8_9ACTN|nr:PAS domain-containing sensor histidine kinase [Jatrophihabitans endophyticus]SHF75643.1 Two-component sensor histidine kinase, contains HisKA and HATPase domains [Jatrophihabitans endophyticus]